MIPDYDARLLITTHSDGLVQVLSDPEKRKIYDQFGEDGLKGGGMPSRGQHSAGPGPSFNFRPRAAEDIFAEVCVCRVICRG